MGMMFVLNDLIYCDYVCGIKELGLIMLSYACYVWLFACVEIEGRTVPEMWRVELYPSCENRG
jgi:hypothetical protein